MFVVSHFLIASAKILDMLLTALYWIIIARALVSWVNPDPYNPIVQFLHKVTEPILYPIRKILPFSLRFGIDVSPIIAIVGIYFLQSFLIGTLVELAQRLAG